MPQLPLIIYKIQESSPCYHIRFHVQTKRDWNAISLSFQTVLLSLLTFFHLCFFCNLQPKLKRCCQRPSSSFSPSPPAHKFIMPSQYQKNPRNIKSRNITTNIEPENNYATNNRHSSHPCSTYITNLE